MQLVCLQGHFSDVRCVYLVLGFKRLVLRPCIELQPNVAFPCFRCSRTPSTLRFGSLVARRMGNRVSPVVESLVPAGNMYTTLDYLAAYAAG